MAVSQAQFPAFYAAVSNDANTIIGVALTNINLNGHASGAKAQLDQYNRDQALLGNAPLVLGDATYTTPTSYAPLGLPVIALPAGTPIPPLSVDLVSQITVGGVHPAPGAPTITPPPPPIGTTTPSNLKPLDQFDPGVSIADYCTAFPDDPYCLLGQDLGGLAGAIGGTTITNNTTVIQESGILAADVHQIVNDALDGLWGAIVTAEDTVLAAVVATVQAAVTGIGNALKAAYAVLSRLSGLILRFLGLMWGSIVHALILAEQHLEELLKDLYDNVLKPLVAGLQKIRAILIDLWQRFIVPLLIIIQDIRRVLVILAAFHVSWAQKLDQKLAQLEAKITGPLIYVLGLVNAVSNWVNLIVAFNYLLQKPLFLASLKAYVGESINLQLNAMNKPLSAADLTAVQNAAAFPPATQSAADFQAYVATGTGAFADLAIQQNAQLETYLTAGV